MMGYWERPEETKKAVIDGCYMDGDGYVYIVDRIKDMIISGGENINSAEVENCIAQHPAVAQCAVIGIPHETWGASPTTNVRAPSTCRTRGCRSPARARFQARLAQAVLGTQKSGCLIGPWEQPTRAACRLSKRMEALIHADGEL